jgi:hypothetical protein
MRHRNLVMSKDTSVKPNRARHTITEYQNGQMEKNIMDNGIDMVLEMAKEIP